MQQQLRYRQLGGNSGRFYSDTFFATWKSISRKSCCQIFINNIGFYHVTPMERESEASNALVEFIQHVGLPNHLHTDGSKTQTLGERRKVVKQFTLVKPCRIRDKGIKTPYTSCNAMCEYTKLSVGLCMYVCSPYPEYDG